MAARSSIVLIGYGDTPTFLPPGQCTGGHHGVKANKQRVVSGGGQIIDHFGDYDVKPQIQCDLRNHGMQLLSKAFSTYPAGPSEDVAWKIGTEEMGYTGTGATIDSVDCSWEYGGVVKLSAGLVGLQANKVTGLAAIDTPDTDDFFANPHVKVEVKVGSGSYGAARCKSFKFGIKHGITATGDGDGGRLDNNLLAHTAYDRKVAEPDLSLVVETPTLLDATGDTPGADLLVSVKITVDNDAGTAYTGFVYEAVGIALTDPDNNSVRAGADGFVKYTLNCDPNPDQVTLTLTAVA